VSPEIVVTTNALSICILPSKILTITMISGCIALHGFGWMQVYFQVGMIIGDTEQHNKICGFFCGGNGLHRQHMSCDCNVTSDDGDNPNIKCTRKYM
jgi:hypothetical protein